MKPNITNKRANLRYQKVLSVGLELFLEKGYSDTSLNEIVERSGGSLSTIYKYFNSKEGLFKAIILNGIKKFRHKLENESRVIADLPLEEFLYEFGVVYFNIILDDKSISFLRLVLSECFNKDTFEIGRGFVSDIDTFMDEYLISFFKKDAFISKFSHKELVGYARLFTYLVREPYTSNAIFHNIKPNLDQTELDTHIKRIVSIFLYGILK